jgi:hypothetical protein
VIKTIEPPLVTKSTVFTLFLHFVLNFSQTSRSHPGLADFADNSIAKELVSSELRYLDQLVFCSSAFV